MSEQRQSLQDKVEALQKKKQSMDALLNQFQDLRPILGPTGKRSVMINLLMAVTLTQTKFPTKWILV